VHFAQSTAELQKFIAPENLSIEYGGSNSYKYQYVLPRAGENAKMADVTARNTAMAARLAACDRLEAVTRKWAGIDSATSSSQTLSDERAAAADDLVVASRAMDKFVRARTLYHRTGVISDDLTIHW
ncbi:phosphatidylinositol transfer protein csr1, partial [Coemansia sp. RSA 530]